MLGFVGLSHRTAPISVRERLALDKSQLGEVLRELHHLAPVGEAMLLSTCNRVEVYVAPPRGVGSASDAQISEAVRAVADRLGAIGGGNVRSHLQAAMGPDALNHLFRVACSLDSMVLGEPQILGQLKDAIELARETGTMGPLLSKAMHKALHVGKRVRTETAIGAGQVSVSSVAVDLARQIFGDLSTSTALLVGAGEMAEAAAKILVGQGARLLVVNRNPERAARLAAEVGGEPRAWGELNWCLIEGDIVISSTASPHFIIGKDAMKTARKARRGRSIFLIDIAVPRDIDPAVNDLENVFCYDVDDLQQVVSESLEGRATEAMKAEQIVAHETQSFSAWTLERELTPTIVGLRARIRSVLAAEMERTLGGKLKHLSDADRKALSKMVDAATNKLCHRPSSRLKELAHDGSAAGYIDALADLFDIRELDVDPSSDDPVKDAGHHSQGDKPAAE